MNQFFFLFFLHNCGLIVRHVLHLSPYILILLSLLRRCKRGVMLSYSTTFCRFIFVSITVLVCQSFCNAHTQYSRNVTVTVGASSLVINTEILPSPISPDLYGVFFEEISHAGVGGLYSQLIDNSNFES